MLGCRAQDRTHKVEIEALGGRVVAGKCMHMYNKLGTNRMNLPLRDWDSDPGWTFAGSEAVIGYVSFVVVWG